MLSPWTTVQEAVSFPGLTFGGTALSHPPHSPRTKSPGGQKDPQEEVHLVLTPPLSRLRGQTSGCPSPHRRPSTGTRHTLYVCPPSSPPQSRAQPLRQRSHHPPLWCSGEGVLQTVCPLSAGGWPSQKYSSHSVPSAEQTLPFTDTWPWEGAGTHMSGGNQARGPSSPGLVPTQYIVLP